MIPIITDDGIRLLPIVFSARLTISVADWNTIYTFNRRDMCCGLVAAMHLRQRSTKLPTYAVLAA